MHPVAQFTKSSTTSMPTRPSCPTLRSVGYSREKAAIHSSPINDFRPRYAAIAITRCGYGKFGGPLLPGLLIPTVGNRQTSFFRDFRYGSAQKQFRTNSDTETA